VLVKDSSRIGRDHLRVGLFREMLRERNVRLIAVNDGLDSARGEDDFTPFRDIMAEWYARDASRKIKSSLETKGRKGVPLSNRILYGYKKNTSDGSRWVIDDYAADIVRRVFNLIVSGKTPNEVCEILHNEKIEKPAYYQARMGYFNCAKALKVEDPYDWSEQMITRMLSREEYCGHVVNFKSKTVSFKSRKQVAIPRDEQMIFKDAHERIVQQETWDLVQKLRQTKRHAGSMGEANPLTGLIFCADCGQKLYHHRTRSNTVDRYICSTYNSEVRRFRAKKCSSHHIGVKALRQIILEVIKKTAGFVRSNEDEFVRILKENSSIKQDQTIKSHTKQIIKNDRRISELDKLFGSIYEDKVKGIIAEERFIQMSKSYEQEQSELKSKNELLQMEIDDFNKGNENIDSFVKLVQRHTHFEELTTPVLNEFIEKVVVYEAVWSEQTPEQHRRGVRTQEVDVYLKYVGNLTLPDERTPEAIEAERMEEEKLQLKRKKARAYERKWKVSRRIKSQEEHQREAPVIV